MESDTIAASEIDTDAEIMAAVEDGPVDRFIVADVTSDNSFVTCPLDDTASLPAWR